ncbi:MAG: hypothetical protein QG602_400 [Verrucomicrobiota bacterium]|jgi:hypothetical protein|nr:hypothetical protein [Verrucomicrobiota bacterium]
MSEPLWQPRSDAGARLLGAGFFLGGAALLAFQGRTILGAIERGETVGTFAAALALGEMGVLLGIYWMIRGLTGYHAVRALREKPAALRWLGVASAVLVGGTLLALHAWLRAQGYDS